MMTTWFRGRTRDAGAGGCNATVVFLILLLSQMADSLKQEGHVLMEILYPEKIAYTYKILPTKHFGEVMKTTRKGLVLIPTDPWHACTQHLDNSNYVQGRVVLIVRGQCSFVTKALNAEKNGAIAAIIVNDDREDIDVWIEMLQDETDRTQDVGIPAFYMLGKDGFKIKQALSSKETVAIANMPLNATRKPQINKPPWDLW